MDERERELKSAIRRLTKRIGEARKASDFNEVENLRKQRGSFAKQLMEEYDQGFRIIDGKTEFLPLDEALEYYQQADVRKKVGVANATNDLLQARERLQKRLMRIEEMTAEEVKEATLKDIEREISKVEGIIEDINEQVGNPPVDFDKIDKQKLTDDDLLDGIDMSSLE